MRMALFWLLVGVFVVLGAVGFFTPRDGGHGSGKPVWTVAGGEPRPGRQAIVDYGCSSCHVIGGVRKATGRVGPKLEEIGEQIYIGGVVPNTPENMIAWIRDPQNFSPETAMPDLDVTEQDARDIAAHLYSQ
jgi:cytochrome c